MATLLVSSFSDEYTPNAHLQNSYATVLKRSGVSTSVISESLGHSSERVTQIYLDSFENKQLDEAMKNLL